MLRRGERPFSSKRSRLALGSTQTPIQWITSALTRGVSRPRGDFNYIPQVLSFIMYTNITIPHTSKRHAYGQLDIYFYWNSIK